MRQTDDGAEGLTPEQEAVASAGLKTLMPISTGGRPGRPFLDYLLSAIADAGIRNVGLVVGPEHDALRRQYSGDMAPSRVAVEFVTQQEARGTADAVLAAEPFVAGRPFLSLNADNLYPVEVLRALRELDGPGLPAFERDELARSSRIPADRIGSFALLAVDADGTLLDIIEKPGVAAVEAAGPRALVSMNCWRFDARIFAACRAVRPSPRGELELPEAVRLAVRQGVRFRVFTARGPVVDLSRREDVQTVSDLLAGRDVRV
jgi:dTDP-glucose pyrophosphorylase